MVTVRSFHHVWVSSYSRSSPSWYIGICLCCQKAKLSCIRLCEDNVDVPVRERTKAHEAACVRFWRNREAFSVQRVNGKKLLCFNGKEVLKRSALRDVIEKEFIHCKGVGARKLKYRLRQRFEGISEQRVQSVLSGSKLNQIPEQNDWLTNSSACSSSKYPVRRSHF